MDVFLCFGLGGPCLPRSDLERSLLRRRVAVAGSGLRDAMASSRADRDSDRQLASEAKREERELRRGCSNSLGRAAGAPGAVCDRAGAPAACGSPASCIGLRALVRGGGGKGSCLVSSLLEVRGCESQRSQRSQRVQTPDRCFQFVHMRPSSHLFTRAHGACTPASLPPTCRRKQLRANIPSQPSARAICDAVFCTRESTSGTHGDSPNFQIRTEHGHHDESGLPRHVERLLDPRRIGDRGHDRLQKEKRLHFIQGAPYSGTTRQERREHSLSGEGMRMRRPALRTGPEMQAVLAPATRPELKASTAQVLALVLSLRECDGARQLDKDGLAQRSVVRLGPRAASNCQRDTHLPSVWNAQNDGRPGSFSASLLPDIIRACERVFYGQSVRMTREERTFSPLRTTRRKTQGRPTEALPHCPRVAAASDLQGSTPSHSIL